MSDYFESVRALNLQDVEPDPVLARLFSHLSNELHRLHTTFSGLQSEFAVEKGENGNRLLWDEQGRIAELLDVSMKTMPKTIDELLESDDPKDQEMLDWLWLTGGDPDYDPDAPPPAPPPVSKA
jgi:hypothetical protein